MDFILLFAGLAVVILGANILTDGASGLALRFRIPEFIVGAIIIGIGTSAPELVVSIGAALKGSGDVAIGNVVGSNLFNTFVILGITALILPVRLSSNNIKKDIPFGVLAAMALFVCSSDIFLGDSTIDSISRSEGLLLLGLFGVFIAYTIFSGSSTASPEPGNEVLNGESVSPDTTRQSIHAPKMNTLDTEYPAGGGVGSISVTSSSPGLIARWKKLTANPWVMAGMVLAGIVALVYGGELFLNNALSISRRYGVSESVIAITLMAGGTSLPELASCVVAALKKKPQLALGNILGSNIANVFLVLGASATINPLVPKGITMTDLVMVIISALLVFATAFLYKKRTVTRIEGGIFVLIYIVYIVWLLYNI